MNREQIEKWERWKSGNGWSLRSSERELYRSHKTGEELRLKQLITKFLSNEITERKYPKKGHPFRSKYEI